VVSECVMSGYKRTGRLERVPVPVPVPVLMLVPPPAPRYLSLKAAMSTTVCGP
jgi:hypothetical protein